MTSHERSLFFAERFRTKLGYEHAIPFPIYSEQIGGGVMFYMIHASDHPAAPRLCSEAYEKTVKRIPPGKQTCFLDSDGS